MDSMNIGIVIGVAVIVALITYFFAKPSKAPNILLQEKETKYAEEKKSLEEKVSALLSEIERLKGTSSSNGSGVISRLNNEIKQLRAELEQCKSVKNSASGVDASKVEADYKLQIKELKDDLEEAKDDLDDLKSKFKKEKAKFEADISEAEENSKKLSVEVESLTDQNKVLKSKIDNKSNAISFVQEILNAKGQNDESSKKHIQSIQNMRFFIEDEVKVCMQKCSKFYEDWSNLSNFLFGESLYKWSILEQKTWLNGKTTVALIGEFSAGKTSIVNRILSQDKPNIPLLPVSTKATTAIPTYISGSVATTYSYYSPDNKLKSISEATFKRVTKEVLDEVSGVSNLVKYFVMTYNNPNLKGLSILDTPGFMSNDKEDAERTIEVVNECDALFWVFDVNQGDAHRDTLALIMQHLKKPLFVVVNKVDTKSPSEVNQVIEKLKSSFNNAGITVEGYIPFSQKAPLADIMSPLVNIKASQSDFNYMDYLESTLDGLNKFLDGEEKTALGNYNENKKVVEEQKGIWISNFKYSADVALEARSLPQWTTHTFSKDRYEMTEYQGDRLKSLLNDLAKDQDDSVKKFPYFVEFVNKMQKSYDNYVDYRDLHRMVSECGNKFCKLKYELSNSQN